tara:strand:- start:461 stop:712 length:252 start_codon:yes stop_codon:yes gene_type:complete
MSKKKNKARRYMLTKPRSYNIRDALMSRGVLIFKGNNKVRRLSNTEFSTDNYDRQPIIVGDDGGTAMNPINIEILNKGKQYIE